MNRITRTRKSEWLTWQFVGTRIARPGDFLHAPHGSIIMELWDCVCQNDFVLRRSSLATWSPMFARSFLETLHWNIRAKRKRWFVDFAERHSSELTKLLGKNFLLNSFYLENLFQIFFNKVKQKGKWKNKIIKKRRILW